MWHEESGHTQPSSWSPALLKFHDGHSHKKCKWAEVLVHTLYLHSWLLWRQVRCACSSTLQPYAQHICQSCFSFGIYYKRLLWLLRCLLCLLINSSLQIIQVYSIKKNYHNDYGVRPTVFTAVKIQIVAFWIMTPCDFIIDSSSSQGCGGSTLTRFHMGNGKNH